MAIFSSLQELKNAITASIYENSTGLITAEILRDRLHDMIDSITFAGSVGALPVATENDLGAIKVGARLSITSEGVLSADEGGGSMTYPGAGIAVSSGSGWGASVEDNSSDWNTAFGWGNHASGGYMTSSGNTTGSSGSLLTTNFRIVEESGKLVFKYGTTVIASLSSAGYMKALDDIQAKTNP